MSAASSGDQFEQQLLQKLAQRHQQQRYRFRQVVKSPAGREGIIDGQQYLNFCSNDYLGLANNGDVKKAFEKAVNEFGVGSGASHLISGHSHHHHALEEELADFLGTPRVLLFSTGFMANLGVLTALVDKSDAIFQDKLNHASLLDGGLASGARFRRYAHNDVSALSALLKKSNAENNWVVTDGVFSMDGDVAPLPSLATACDQHQAYLMVDDAHGFGVLGEQGRGSADAAGVMPDVQVYMATLGKALGTFGAFVAGSDALVEALIQFARSYVYTTAMPPAVAAASRESLRIMRHADDRRQHLAELIAQFRSGALQQGWQLMDSATAIQPILVGDEEAALKLSEDLKHKGLLISAIRPPTVPQGQCRLRITLSAAHHKQDVQVLLDALETLAKTYLN